MLRLACSLFIAAGLAAADPSAEEAWRIGWPYLGGPTGNLLPLRTTTPLVEDLAQARLAWVTTEADLGAAKTGSQTFVGSAEVEARIGPDARNPPGNWAAVVVADGRVFASTFQPAGPVFTAPYKTNKPYEKGETAQVPTRFRVAADDVVVCHDARDGHRLWIAREPGGILLAGGKRGGFQVAPAVDGGRVFALGSTGRLFAYDAASGQRLWQVDIGAARAAAAKSLADGLAQAAAGVMVLPGEPDLHVSLVAVDGAVIATDATGKLNDVGLIGFDAGTGERRWRLSNCISRYATPSVWRHAGKAWLLCATDAGQMRLIDPTDGKVAWMLDGLGRNWSTLAPGERTVMVNVKPTVGKRGYGVWGAVRISPARAERAWALPDEPRNAIPTWMDTGARQGAFVRDGRVLVPTEGTKEAPGRILLLDEETGAILAEAPQQDALGRMGELVWWLGDRALVRADNSHGPRHGGRHPIMGWTTLPGSLGLERSEDRLSGMDLVDFDTAYEVMMQPPLIDGRIFERTDDGRLACYDLRRLPVRTWKLALAGAQPGMPPLEVRVWSDGPVVTAAKAWIPDSEQTGIPWSRERRFAMWQAADRSALRVEEGRLRGDIGIDFVTHRWSYTLDVGPDGTGTWRRTVPAAPEVRTATGTFSGRVSDERVFPTPWLKESPWTRIGANPPGTRTWVLQLDGAIPLKEPARGMNLCIDYAGTRAVRAAGTAYSFAQAWHDVDASALRLGEEIAGTATVVLNGDHWVQPVPETGLGLSGRIDLQGKASADGTLSGTFTAVWGAPLQAEGPVSAALTAP